MKLTRGKRIALELLGPPALGAGFWMLATMTAAIWTRGADAWSKESLPELIGLQVFFAIYVILYAYVFAAIPSMLYATIIEWCFTHGLDPRSWWAVGWSAALGFLSGTAIVGAFGFNGPATFSPWLYFGGIGTAVGFVLGVMIKALSPKPATEGSP